MATSRDRRPTRGRSGGVAPELLEGDARRGAHPFLYLAYTRVERTRHHVDLHTVARREHRRLLDVREGRELRDRARPLGLRGRAGRGEGRRDRVARPHEVRRRAPLASGTAIFSRTSTGHEWIVRPMEMMHFCLSAFRYPAGGGALETGTRGAPSRSPSPAPRQRLASDHSERGRGETSPGTALAELQRGWGLEPGLYHGKRSAPCRPALCAPRPHRRQRERDGTRRATPRAPSRAKKRGSRELGPGAPTRSGPQSARKGREGAIRGK